MRKLIFFLCFILIVSACESSTSQSSKTNSKALNYEELYAKAPSGATPTHFKGGQNATVVIEEFADFQCPSCAFVHPTVQELHATYGDKIKIIFRNFPLPVHSKAFDAALAAEAAGMQGKFWEMQNLLFSNQKIWAVELDHRRMFEEYARKLGLDVERFRADMFSMVARNRVEKDLERGRALKVQSTPTFFVNGRPLNYEDTEFQRFRAVIDAELKKANVQ